MNGHGAGKWWESVFFGLHYDLHASAQDTVLGAELTPEHLREQLEKVRPDFIQCDCKGHPGYASYPTKVGSPASGIVRDALRIHRDVTREMDIPLSVHYSGVYDVRAVELHPDWAALDAEGRPVLLNPQDKAGVICRLGPYVEELMIPQMLEIIDNYDVDGFWIDGDSWAVRECYCPRCREELSRRTGIDDAPADMSHPDWPVWRAFHRDTFAEYVRKYTDAVHARKPECAVCSNWMYSMRYPGPVEVPVDYLSGDFSPSFGCERAEMEGRYLDGHGMPWNLMAWTFCKTTEEMPYQTKTAVQLCQEAAEVMSCGGAVFLYDLPQRSGRLNTWHQDMFAEVARFCRARQPFCQYTQSVPQAVVLLSDQHIWDHNPLPFCMGDSYHCIDGALHLLIENGYHADALDETRLLERMEEYAVVVVGEQKPISAGMEEALEAYARQGGIVVISGSHLAEDQARLVGVSAAGPEESREWFMPVQDKAVTLAGPWRPVKATDSDIYAFIMSDMQPDKDKTEYPAVTVRRVGNGKIAAIHGDFMRSYYQSHHPLMRLFMKDLLDYLQVKRTVEMEGPPSLELSLRHKDDKLFIHLVNRSVSPTLHTFLHIVEEVPAAENVGIRVRLAGRPSRVTLEPGAREVEWRYTDGILETRIPSVHIHEILAVEGVNRTLRNKRLSHTVA